jgi:2-C-methyl-D-erythritol 2,4-cyclodiphosphate synthase
LSDVRIGLGFDTHPHDEGRPLFLGGVRFDGEPGLLGHSDGDVVCHAVADAMLGAAGLGDLGQHFPDTDPAVEGIRGLDLLGRVMAMVIGERLAPVGCDVTFVGVRPLLGPRREEIRANLAAALRLGDERVSVKATRPDGLGLSGDGAGCLAIAVLEPA